MEFLLEGCLWVAEKLTGYSRDGPAFPGWRERQASRHLLGMGLFFALVIGVPTLVVVWGYATGRLPAPSPYVD